MAHFRGTLQGWGSEASRLGTKVSGLQVYAAGWGGGIAVSLDHDRVTGKDTFVIQQSPHHGAGVSETIATGVLGQPVTAQGKRELRARRARQRAESAA